jgi:hypothetical protein
VKDLLESLHFDAALRPADTPDIDEGALGCECKVNDVSLPAFVGAVVDNQPDLFFLLQLVNVLDHIKHSSG